MSHRFDPKPDRSPSEVGLFSNGDRVFRWFPAFQALMGILVSLSILISLGLAVLELFHGH